MNPPVNKMNQAYEAIESMIIFQDLAPGSMVSEAQLMELTGFGRSPVREALQRLANDRLVEIYPYKGVFIPAISVEVQLKVLELRRCVGEFAVRLATRRGTHQQKKEMLQLAEAFEAINNISQMRQFGALLKQSYALIGLAAENEYLQPCLSPLQGLSSRFWFAQLSASNQHELVKASQLNAVMLRNICHGDEELAASASKNVNDYFTEFTYKVLAR
ncbi:GntR family transcriptional regulator [Citrobacter amalonaticus]|uniref:GntR family transcriptional regulator n=1 Tax=Trabulsiella odontotermitis TaxID=379893 RepID=A0A0L0GQA2_9ENTR|nr:GntR family transcriptional regulator [Trabulsiella odontotermitis]EGT3573089.1 GntR family transcriptional regulator [Citrobacter amalonaticus]EGT4253680.1 GntR family transcriptional regulator [Citrobacter amalonaticus]KNC88269.1 GntR family transcriptional regulator [Trabulsiella odontotermitis]KNC91235.1 GntR family transcriptional regulator [Trabulsiella odontotermitis]